MMNFATLTIAELIKLAQSTNLDDTELAHRLARRIELTVRQNIAGLNSADQKEMLDLAFVTDADLLWLSGNSTSDAADWPAHAESETILVPKEIE